MTLPTTAGIIGLGTIARTHLAVLATHSDVTVAFAVDPDPTADAIGHLPRTPAGQPPSRYNNLTAAFRDHDPDLLIIATPTGTHLDLTRHALTHSHARVLVEKPLVHDLDALHQIHALKATTELQNRLFVAHHFAFAPEVLWATDQIAANPGWGPPTHITAAFHDPYIAHADHARDAYVSSWTDSGPNQLSMLQRFVHLDTIDPLQENPDRTRSWTTARYPTGTARLLTSWNAAASSKRTTIHYGETGVDVWLDHTAMTAFATRDGELLAVLDNDAHTPRKIAHYTPLYNTLLTPTPDPIIGLDTATHVVRLLCSAGVTTSALR